MLGFGGVTIGGAGEPWSTQGKRVDWTGMSNSYSNERKRQGGVDEVAKRRLLRERTSKVGRINGI